MEPLAASKSSGVWTFSMWGGGGLRATRACVVFEGARLRETCLKTVVLLGAGPEPAKGCLRSPKPSYLTRHHIAPQPARLEAQTGPCITVVFSIDANQHGSEPEKGVCGGC